MSNYYVSKKLLKSQKGSAQIDASFTVLIDAHSSGKDPRRACVRKNLSVRITKYSDLKLISSAGRIKPQIAASSLP